MIHDLVVYVDDIHRWHVPMICFHDLYQFISYHVFSIHVMPYHTYSYTVISCHPSHRIYKISNNSCVCYYEVTYIAYLHDIYTCSFHVHCAMYIYLCGIDVYFVLVHWQNIDKALMLKSHEIYRFGQWDLPSHLDPLLVHDSNRDAASTQV